MTDPAAPELTDPRELRRRAEERARQLSHFPEENPNPVLRVSADGVLLYANPPARQWLAAFGGQDRGPLPDEVCTVVADAAGQDRVVDAEITNTAGSTLWFSAVRPPGEQYVNLYGRDITERKHVEQELRRIKEEWERTFDAVSDPIAILDHAHRVVRVNRVMAERLGTAPEQCVGLPCYRVVHGTDTPPSFCPHLLTCEDGEAHCVEVHEDRLGGDFLVTTTPLTDKQGRRVGAVHVARDITERKQSETALRKSEQRLKRAQEIAHLGSWELDLNENALTWADEVYRIFGLAPQEFPATYDAFLEHVHPDDRAAVDAAYSSSLREGRDAYEVEHRVVRKRTGEVRWVHEKCQHVRDPDGRIVRSLGMVLDITDRKQAEEQIRASLAEKEVLLKEIHHRVKNNMQVISSLVGLQADELPDPAMRSVLREVTHRVRSMAVVHEKLYQSNDLSRVEFGEYARSLLNYLWRAHGTAAQRVRLALDLEPVSLSVTAAVPCGLILNELAGNALKHAFRDRDGGEVAVSLHGGEGGEVRLRVRDDGRGLPPGLDWRGARSLGLRLVLMLAGQIGGTVDAASREDEGTQFEVLFSRASP